MSLTGILRLFSAMLGVVALALAPPALLALLEFAPLTLDQLAARSTLPVTELLSALRELELAGWVEQSGGGWQRCR